MGNLGFCIPKTLLPDLMEIISNFEDRFNLDLNIEEGGQDEMKIELLISNFPDDHFQNLFSILVYGMTMVHISKIENSIILEQAQKQKAESLKILDDVIKQRKKNIRNMLYWIVFASIIIGYQLSTK